MSPTRAQPGHHRPPAGARAVRRATQARTFVRAAGGSTPQLAGPMIHIVVGVIIVVLVIVLVVLLIAILLAVLPTGPAQNQASKHARADIPARYRALYQRAAHECPGLSWTVLAAIGKVESNHGRAADQTSSAGAVGPMQFLPATFAAYARPVPTGGKKPPTPWDPVDATHAAARMLCDNGAKHGAHPHRAVYAYNHSRRYVTRVLHIAAAYRTRSAIPLAGGGAGRRAVTWALTQRGKPYEWAATGPRAYDCSGLTMRAWQHAGGHIPRVTYQQYTTGTRVPRDRLRPGDLVFFHPGPHGPEHVGLYIGHGRMVQAPHTGDVVKISPIGRADYLGARRPHPRSALQSP